jgi:uncharacterized membrane protein
MLVLLGTLLVMGPDFFYLQDGFGDRMNTVFKFYYQAWLLWSLAAAFGVTVMLQALRRAWSWNYRIGLALVLFMALAYPVLGLAYKTNDFKFPAFRQELEAARAAGDPSPWRTAASVWTLDGTAFARPYAPDDMAAVDWLQTAPSGVIAEATDPGASYRFEFGMISTFTGLPTVLGWPGHELQWRPYALQGTRMDDLTRLYEDRNWDEAQAIIQQYGIRYVYVGTLERSHYRVNEAKFKAYLRPVFQQGDVVIYEVP